MQHACFEFVIYCMRGGPKWQQCLPLYTTHAPGQQQRLSLYTILYMLPGSARKVSWAGPAQLKCFARMRVPAYHKPSQSNSDGRRSGRPLAQRAAEPRSHQRLPSCVSGATHATSGNWGDAEALSGSRSNWSGNFSTRQHRLADWIHAPRFAIFLKCMMDLCFCYLNVGAFPGQSPCCLSGQSPCSSGQRPQSVLGRARIAKMF